MELYIGGYAQGKLDYVLQQHPKQQFVMMDGAQMTAEGVPVLFNHFHLWVKELVWQGEDAEGITAAFVEAHPDCIIISDEVGCGIVPMEQKEREYRERLGRILTGFARRAERVERILCGMGQRLK